MTKIRKTRQIKQDDFHEGWICDSAWIHSAETALSALFGKAGSISVEFPGKFTMQRTEAEGGKTKDNKEDGK